MARPQSREMSNPSPDKAKWELGWQDSDTTLKIAVFDPTKDKPPTTKGASDIIRQKIKTMEAAMTFTDRVGGKRKRRMSKLERRQSMYHEKALEPFRCLVRSVILILRCFRMRQKIAVQSGDTFQHQEKFLDFSTTERSSISWKMRMVFQTPPEMRQKQDLSKVVAFLRACGAVRAMLGQTSVEDDVNFARYVSYERYESGRVVAQQDRTPDRLYFILSGKMLVLQDYHVGNSVISKTVSVLSKGDTSNVEDLLKQHTRTHNLICGEKVEAFVLDRDEYFILRRDKTGGAKEFLSSHHLFRLFPSSLLQNSRGVMRLQYYPNGSVIFRGGREYEWIYVVKSGECSLVRTQSVANVMLQKKTLFNKQTPEELGCDHMTGNIVVLAGFRAWKGESSKTRLQRRATAPKSFKSHLHHTAALNLLSESRTNEQLSTSRGRAQLIKDDSTKQSDKDSSSEPQHQTVSFPQVNLPDLDPPNQNVTCQDTNRAARMDSAMLTAARDNGYHNNPKRNELGATMRPILKRSRIGGHHVDDDGAKTTAAFMTEKSSPLLRTAYLELGKLQAGDVYGLNDLFGGAEDVTQISLVSNGADVVAIHRRFFLRNAPAKLLIQLSRTNHELPSPSEASAALEVTDTWNMYKSALIRLLTTGGKKPLRARTVTHTSTTQPRKLNSHHHRVVENRSPASSLPYLASRALTPHTPSRTAPARANLSRHSTRPVHSHLGHARRSNSYSAPVGSHLKAV